jgi:small subunit ribosomal protein S13|tara:strand:+ start:214 stop:582 length:369 start_codon:yes stop_codon:yes gene_type:complete
VVRISGIDLPYNQKVNYALTSIYGIGLTTSGSILSKAGVNLEIRTKDLDDTQIIAIREVIDNDYVVEGDLRRSVGLNLKRLGEINCVKGRRHRQSLPVRGQRTRTNARTRRGSKKTVTGKKK